MPAPSHYDLLGLPLGASADELRQAFRSLSKRYHPDTTTLPLPQAEAAFQQLQRAYSVLSDPERRRLYDAQLLARMASGDSAAASLAPRPSPTAAEASRASSPRRPLSGGEWLALLLLALAAGFSLLLGVGAAWLRGAELVQWPSWWLDAR